uniref:Uncharacterized protein n=1 Tax=Tetradesmus obliquus TaxID=3088 RepID=A0A383VY58_TETOB|eukprot:jgi/Sobl393_1/11966/SZX70141.1
MDPTAAVAAYAAGSLGYSINAQGFLLFYVLGAVKVLGDLGLIGPEAVTASRGTASLVSAAVCSRVPYDHILAALQQYWGASNDAGLSLSSRRALLRQAADQMLAADAHTLCSLRAFVQTKSFASKGRPKSPAAPSGSSSSSKMVSTQRPGVFHAVTAAGAAAGSSLLTDVFDSRAALLDAILDSSFPVQDLAQGDTSSAAAAAAAAHSSSAGPAAAGAAALQLSQALGAAAGVAVPCPANVRHCVKISAVPPQQVQSHSSSSSSSSSSRITETAEATAYADVTVASPSGSSSSSSSTAGASNSAGSRGPETAGVEETESAAAAAAAAAAAVPQFSRASADIYPGLSQRMLLPRAEWLSYMLLPPSIKALSYMHYLGRVDAYVWANSTGLVKAAVAEQQQQLTGLLLQDISFLDRVDALFQKFVQWKSGQ